MVLNPENVVNVRLSVKLILLKAVGCKINSFSQLIAEMLSIFLLLNIMYETSHITAKNLCRHFVTLVEANWSDWPLRRRLRGFHLEIREYWFFVMSKTRLYWKRGAEAFRIYQKFIESIIFDSRQFARLTKDMTSKMFQLSLSKAGKLNASRSLNLASFQNTLTIVGLPNIFGQCSVKTLTIAKMNCAKST